jgi:hypothetical protein
MPNKFKTFQYRLNPHCYFPDFLPNRSAKNWYFSNYFLPPSNLLKSQNPLTENLPKTIQKSIPPPSNFQNPAKPRPTIPPFIAFQPLGPYNAPHNPNP